jgi:nucleoside-diphosphate-sugar epimerase
MDTTIFRSPTIVSAGRLGLLGILFQFIEEGRRVYIVGGGRNRYQFVYALDYCRAILLALEKQLSGTYNVGSSDVPTMADSYQHVINQADSGARLVHLPRGLTIFLLRILHVLRLSPLGPYQYRMIASSFEFDITKLKHDAGWQPKLTNNDMLLEAYNHYKKNKLITSDQSTSAHNRVARGGILDLVRKLS